MDNDTDKDAISDATTWVDDVIAKLQGATNGILEVKIGGQTVQAFIGVEVVQFFSTNKILLERLGLDMFRNFLTLLSEKKEEEAFNVLLDKMQADEIIARLNMDANQLQQMNDDYDAFVAAAKKWALTVLEAAATKLIIGLLPIP